MKSTFLVAGTMLLASAIFISCKKDNTNTGIMYQLKVINPLATIARVAGGTIQWSSGYAWATEIKFEAKKSNNEEVEYKTQALQKVNIFIPAISLGSISLPEGTYKEIEFKIETAPNGADAAFLLNGTYTNGGVTTPVVFKVTAPLEVKTEKENFTITAGTNYTAITSFDLSLLSQGITEVMLNNATRTNGTIEISATSNTNLYNILIDRLDDCDGIEIDD